MKHSLLSSIYLSIFVHYEKNALSYYILSIITNIHEGDQIFPCFEIGTELRQLFSNFDSFKML